MTRRATAAAALLVLGAASGCATSADNAPSGHSSTTGGSGSPSKAPASSPSPSPMLTPTAPAGTALGSGQRVWAAFSERGLSQKAWWTQLKPLLSDSAQAVYVYDDPSKIPAMKLTGKIHVAAKAPDQAGFTVEVLVPTDKGQFGLDLERRTLKSAWLMYAIKFPPGVH